MDAPVAKPSSIRKTVRPLMGSGGRSPRKRRGAAGQFTLLLAGYLLDTSVGQPLLRDNGLVNDLNAAFGDGAEGQFSLAGYAQFSHE